MMSTFIQLSLIILVVVLVSFIIRLLRQPLIIGYILSGIIIGPFLFNLISQDSILHSFSEFGIAFLLFIVGLHLSPKVIKEVGKVSLITGIGQVIFTSVIGYLIGILLGFTPLTAIYIAIALTFSSTIIIMKLLSDKESLEKLYGKISIGFLLVQDLVAIIILMVISSFSTELNATNVLLSTILKGLGAITILTLISLYLLPRLSNFFARSQELLFLFSLGWGLGLAALFSYIGFSIEVGALIAGIMLSISPYSYEVGSKLKPLRDFFIISFFLILGSQMVFGDITKFIVPAILFSLFILIGNPLIVMILMGLLGYSKKTGFMAGLTVAQISEFSLILIALGVKIGNLSNEILSFVTMIGLVTIAGSTYLIMYSDRIYPHISRYLSLFEKKNIKEKSLEKKPYDCILLGYNRVGFSILKSFSKISKNQVVIDFNPEVITKLSSRKVKCIYGDVEDMDILGDLQVDKAKIIVSTIPEFEINRMLLNKLRNKNKKMIIILTARQISDAFKLYELGADYIIMPHFLGGEYTAKIIEKSKDNRLNYKEERNSQIKDLKERLREGHEHPRIEKR